MVICSGGRHGHCALLAKQGIPGAVNAWVCQGVTWLPPVDAQETLLDLLDAPELR
jgi:hypothetical protein